ncbi:unnamed protein product [Calypogeia fissa]
MASDKVANLLSFVPKVLRPQTTDLSGAVLWGGAAFTGALFLVQPFTWIKDQFNPPPEEEKK